MLLLGVKERYQEKVREILEKQGIRASLWYECNGDEDVVIVPQELAVDDGALIEVEVCEA